MADDPWLHAVIDVPASRHAATAGFWSAALGWPVGDAWSGHPELRSFVAPEGTPYVHLQRIDGEPRVHLDIGTPTRAAADALVERALGAGASSTGVQDRWRSMTSPGGLPFCVVVDTGEPPREVTWSDGHRTRLVQVCVDSPRPVHDDEVAFWRALLGGRWVGSEAMEFAGKWHQDGSPLQLLLQRLDEPDGAVRAHLDLGTDDLAAEVRRLVDLGAEDVGAGRGWHVLRDPAGLAFCATGNAPAGVHDRDLG